MKRTFAYLVFGAGCVLGLVFFSGCSIAEKAPDSYLTEQYYAAPVFAAVAQPAETDALPVSFNRVTATPVKPAKGKPPKPVHIDTSAAAKTAADEQKKSSSSDPEYADKTYTETVTDDKKATYNNVEVSAADVVLESKYIKGDFTVTSDALYSLTLIGCKIDGQLIVKGASLYELNLENCVIDTLRLASGEYVDVTLEGVSYIKETVLSSGTAANLYAYNIQSGYSGYKAITIAKSSRTSELTMYGVDCQNLTVNSESEITLDDDNTARVEACVVNAPATITGAYRIQKLYVRSGGIVLDTEPGELIYGKSKYTVDYTGDVI